MNQLLKNVKQRLANQRGFSLMELVVVIAVLGILAAFLVPNLSSITGDASDTKLKSDAQAIKAAVEAYHAHPNAQGVLTYPRNLTLADANLARYFPTGYTLPPASQIEYHYVAAAQGTAEHYTLVAHLSNNVTYDAVSGVTH